MIVFWFQIESMYVHPQMKNMKQTLNHVKTEHIFISFADSSQSFKARYISLIN